MAAVAGYLAGVPFSHCAPHSEVAVASSEVAVAYPVALVAVDCAAVAYQEANRLARRVWVGCSDFGASAKCCVVSDYPKSWGKFGSDGGKFWAVLCVVHVFIIAWVLGLSSYFPKFILAYSDKLSKHFSHVTIWAGSICRVPLIPRFVLQCVRKWWVVRCMRTLWSVPVVLRTISISWVGSVLFMSLL